MGKSLNHRDAFIVDKGRNIWRWYGDNCSPFIKNAANMKAEKMEAASIGEQNVVQDIDNEFWKALGVEEADIEEAIKSITPADQVGEEVPADFGEGVLYSVAVDEDRKLSVTEVARGDLDRSQLDSTNVMMVDTKAEIFLWLGKDCSQTEKASAFSTASNYLKGNGRNVDKTAITILKEGHDHKSKSWLKMFPLK